MKEIKLEKSEINLLKRTEELSQQINKISAEGKMLNMQFWKELQDRLGYKSWTLNDEKTTVHEMSEEEKVKELERQKLNK
jgi:hypothetical protein